MGSPQPKSSNPEHAKCVERWASEGAGLLPLCFVFEKSQLIETLASTHGFHWYHSGVSIFPDKERAFHESDCTERALILNN